jgi:hypothetical protein
MMRQIFALAAHRVAFFAVAVAVNFGLARIASAEVLPGSYRQTALSESFAVESWKDSCGPAPKSSSQGGGETVTIAKQGDELVISGGGRTYSTAQCYDAMPTLTRESHAAGTTAWRTRCKTPTGDPRRASVQTQIIATETGLSLSETARYEVTVEEGTCVAVATRSRNWTRIVEAPAAQPTASAAPAPSATSLPSTEPVAPCVPGEPARITIRPSKKAIKPGDSFTYSVLVADEALCPITSQNVLWTISPETTVTVDAKTGRVTVPRDAGPGAYTVTAAAFGKRVQATLDVVENANYERFLREEKLSGEGESGFGVTTEIPHGGGSLQKSTATDVSPMRRGLFLGAIGVTCILLLGVAAFSWRRARLAKRIVIEETSRHQAEVLRVARENEAKQAAYEAQKRAHDEGVKAQQERRDARVAKAKAEAERKAREQTKAPPALASMPTTPIRKLQCPACGASYESNTLAFCSQDGTKLIEKA